MHIKRIISILVFGLIIISSYACKVSKKANDEKVFCDAKISDNYCDNSIIVILKKDYQDDKDYEIADFVNDKNDDDFLSIVELTTDYHLLKKNNKLKDTYRRIFKLTLKEKNKANVLNVIRSLEKNPIIKYVGVEPIVEQNIFDSGVNTSELYHPNQYDSLTLANIINSWNVSTGSSDVLVGIMDSGIDSLHEDLQANLNTSLSADFTSGQMQLDPTPFDDVGHGTFIAGIIGATNNNYGVVGICHNVSLVSLKIYKSSDGNDLSTYCVNRSTRVIQALSYANANNIHIVNCSIGLYAVDSYYAILEEQAINNYNGLLICAAGNNGYNIDVISAYPGSYSCDNIITVGGINNQGGVAQFGSGGDSYSSNYGAYSVDIFAPGTGIYSTLPNNLYEELDGTSYATAFVTGACALLASEYNDLSSLIIKSIILDSASYSSNYQCVSHGALDAYKAITLNVMNGTGSSSNPFLIDSIADLYAIGYVDSANIYYRQIQNIDGKGLNNLLCNYVFKGHYNGNQCYIDNLDVAITNTNLSNIGGLFGKNEGSISNLKIYGLSISVTSVNYDIINVGGLVGYNCGIINNVQIINSEIITTSPYITTGGVAGSNCNQSIYYCISNCTLDGTTLRGNGNIGGIIGENVDGIIDECTICNNTIIEYDQIGMNNRCIGGIVGFNYDSLSYCYVSNDCIIRYISAPCSLYIKPMMGSIIGRNWANSINNCISYINITPGFLSGVYDQLDYIGAYSSGRIGLDETY